MSNAKTTRDRTVAEWRRITLTRAIHAVVAASGMRISSGGKSKAMSKESNNLIKSKGTKAMSQEMIKHAEVENIQTAAQADFGFEKILKFKKGHFFTGEEEIPLGTEYIAHAKAWTKCWIKFSDSEVVERKVYRVAYGEQPPDRSELDDQDEESWSKGLDGRPADPWVYQYLLPLENPSSGEVIVFVTPSFGGRRAIADLCTAYVRRTKKVTNCGQPIIKLAVTDMPTKKFGKVPRPNFVIVGWDEPSADSDVEVMPASPSPTSLKNEFNDDVPF